MKNLIKTLDGSNTLYSNKYSQNFHDINTGAIQESLSKHVIPALNAHKNKKHLRILDICFGLGYNTFCTILYVLDKKLDVSLEFFSPELDADLIQSLETFSFPDEFNKIQHIIKALVKYKFYKDDKICINLHIGDARAYIKTLANIDIIYQDAFSSEVNTELWTVEYFKDIYKLCNENSVLTTYSVATPIRLSLYQAGFCIYEIKPIKKKQTLAFISLRDINAKYIDMELKKTRNKEARALYD